MKDSPAFLEEKQILDSVKKWINKQRGTKDPRDIPIDRVWEVYGGADEYTAMVFRLRAIEEWCAWGKIAETPYYGRIDYERDGLRSTFYIGYYGFHSDHIQVLDWRAPVASLYYQDSGNSTDRNAVYAPGGMYWVRLRLKRRIEIKGGNLESVADEIDRRSGGSEKQGAVVEESKVAEDFLRRSIEKRGDPRLQDIVQTIQAHQDRLIRASAGQILVINGVPGSGKTSVAYHRIAYLIFPESNTGIDPRKVIVFGPNRLFLSYVENLLPSIGVKNIVQTTFDDWALELMRLVVRDKDGNRIRKVQIADQSLAVFLNQKTDRDTRRKHWLRAKLKGSLRFGRIIERYVEEEKQSFQLPTSDLTYSVEIEGVTLQFPITVSEINEAYRRVLGIGRPLVASRNEFFHEIQKKIQGNTEQAIRNNFQTWIAQANHELNAARQIRDSIGATSARQKIDQLVTKQNKIIASHTKMRKVIDDVLHQLTEDFEHLWPSHQLLPAYQRLLSDPERLERLCHGLLTPEEIDLLNSSPPVNGVVDLEDIPGLFYLYMLASSWDRIPFDHVVIDEAQDFCPLQFKILRSLCKSGSMTILGDVAQGILTHRGINSWEEIRETLPSDKVAIEEIQQNYRSTREIVEFTNSVLQMVQKNRAKPAIPFDRKGDKPTLAVFHSSEEMAQQICADIAQLLRKGYQNIGIIVKTAAECTYIAKQVNREQSTKVHALENRDKEYNYLGGIVVVPVALSKGLEFEAVLVVNADIKRYDSAVDYDGRLFYVAVTRALHHLAIYAVGKPTPYANSLSIERQ